MLCFSSLVYHVMSCSCCMFIYVPYSLRCMVWCMYVFLVNYKLSHFLTCMGHWLIGCLMGVFPGLHVNVTCDIRLSDEMESM